MLAKKLRVDISALKGQKPVGQKRNQYFLLKFFKNDFGASRFGVVIPKKVLPLASSRNKVKRDIFDFFAKEKGRFNPGNDYLLIASSKVSGLIKDKSAIVEQLLELLRD